MKIKCPECDKLIPSSVSKHKYTESGLENVYLENINIYECACGLSIPSIFRVGRLNDLRAEKLLSKPALLDGNEIIFLRKNIPMSSTIFARMIGVDKTTFSKWENERQLHREANDRLIRLLYMLQKDFNESDANKILKPLLTIKLKKQPYDFILIAMKIEDDYIVKMMQVTGAQVYDKTHVQICWGECIQAVANPRWTVQGSHWVEPDSVSQSFGTLGTETQQFVHIYS